jgi:flagellin-like protein
MDHWLKTLKRFARNKKAISGLETAIVLIAFVIVASAFAYAVLNMGFLATQKSQQVVLGGLGAASSALVVDGPVYGYSTAPGPTGNITSIIFWLKTASAASSVDLNVNKTTIGFQNSRGVWPNIYNTGGRTFSYTVGGIRYEATATSTEIVWEAGSGYQLMPSQKVRVTIDLTQLTMSPTNPTGVGGCINQAEGCQYAGEVMKNEEFKIVVKPPVGSVLEIDRIAPASVETVNDLG